MAIRKAPETCVPVGSYANSDADQSTVKVVVDFDTLKSLALHGTQDRVEATYVLTRKAMDRLGLKKGSVFKQVERVNVYPNSLDLSRWLDAIDKKSRKYKVDRQFLVDFHATLEDCLPPSVLKKYK